MQNFGIGLFWKKNVSKIEAIKNVDKKCLFIINLFADFCFFIPPWKFDNPYYHILHTKKLWWNLFFFLHLETCHLFFVQKNRKKEFRKYGKKVKFCLAKLVRSTCTVCLHCFQFSMPENKNFTYSNVALFRRRQKTSKKSGI